MIYNSNVGKTIVEKNTDSLKKLAVAANKLLIDRQKSAIGYEKSRLSNRNIMNPQRQILLKYIMK